MCQCSKNLIRSPALTLVNSILRLMFFMNQNMFYVLQSLQVSEIRSLSRTVCYYLECKTTFTLVNARNIRV